MRILGCNLLITKVSPSQFNTEEVGRFSQDDVGINLGVLSREHNQSVRYGSSVLR